MKKSFWQNKSVLITGGTGSLGKKLTNHILTNNITIHLRIYQREEEFKAHYNNNYLFLQQTI